MTDVSRLKSLAVNDAGFVFDPMTGHSYNVNSTGLMLLHGLTAGESVDEVVARLRDTFEIEPEDDVRRDVEDFLVRLREDGLVR